MKIAAALALVFVVSACNSTPTSGPHASVQLRDGTAINGMVLSNTGGEIKIAGDDNIIRTIPMSQVRAVEYGDAVATAPSAATSLQPKRAAAPPQTASRPPSAAV